MLLSAEDLEVATREALRRQGYNTDKGLKGVNGAPAHGNKALAMHITGCIGEVAVAKLLGLEEWLFIDESPVAGSADLPGLIDVKTRPKHGYDMLIQRRDLPEKRYVLATVEHSRAVIPGWLPGHEAMKEQYIKAYQRGRPCYAVPQSALRPIEELLQVAGLDRPQGPFQGPDGEVL